jgi:type I restriction enzyme S subunit
MARSLYREWFVEFRFPGHERTTTRGGVPEGWSQRRLDEISDCNLGKMLDQRKNRGELMPYLGNVNVRWGEFVLDNLKEMPFEPHEVEKCGLEYGDIVMCEGGEPGRCAIWKNQIPGMMIQKAIHRIRPHRNISFEFLYQCLLHKGSTGQLASLFTGATIKHLPGEKLANVEVKVPTEKLMKLFSDYVSPMELQIHTLQADNRCAAATRDLLLPRLISGEIELRP